MSRILSGDVGDGTLYACVDPGARHVTPKVQELRFAATLTPFPDEAAAQAALKENGATSILGGSK